MARARDILIRFLGDTKDLEAAGKKTETTLDRVKQGIGNIGNAAKALVGVQLGRTLIDWAHAAAEDARAQDILAKSLETNVGATQSQIKANEEWISSMQLATLTADNDLRQAVTSLTVAGFDLAKSQEITATAIDVAAARGLNLKSVIDAIVRAKLSGATAGLSRLGIATRDASGELLELDDILKQAAETMGGTAARAADTAAGKLERLKIQWEETKEEIGAEVLPVLVALTEQLFKVGDAYTNAEDGSLRWRTALLGDAELLGLVLPGLREWGAAIADWAVNADDAEAKQRDLQAAVVDYHDELDAGRHRRTQITDDLGDMGDAAGETEDEVSSLADAVKALFNPVRQVRKAQEDWEDAARRQAQALASGKGDTEEATEAGLDLAEAYVDMNIAAGQLDASGLIGFLQGIAGSAGIAQSSIDGVKDALDSLRGLGAINIPINVGITTTSTSTTRSPQTTTITSSILGIVEN